MWDVAWVTGQQRVSSSLIHQGTALQVWFEGIFWKHGGKPAVAKVWSSWEKDWRFSGLGSPRFQGRAAIAGLGFMALMVTGIPQGESMTNSATAQWQCLITSIFSGCTHMRACDLPSSSNELNRPCSSYTCPSLYFDFSYINDSLIHLKVFLSLSSVCISLGECKLKALSQNEA